MNRAASGRAGEEAALAYLVEKGMTPLARNFRASGGEVDLILRDGRYTVFVEVKRRSSARYGLGREAVSPAKIRRICLAASVYISRENLWQSPLRFDVVEIQEGRISHLPGAFDFVLPG